MLLNQRKNQNHLRRPWLKNLYKILRFRTMMNIQSQLFLWRHYVLAGLIFFLLCLPFYWLIILLWRNDYQFSFILFSNFCYSSLLPLSFSSNGKPPRPSFITTIPASGLYANQKLGQPSNLVCQPNLEKQFEPASNDEMPEILRGDGSSGIKTSPNGKRVLSPNVDTGSSPGLRAGRKLILQSIPSFPSLSTPHH